MSFFSRPAESILHPTDFSPTSEAAFAHALAIAIKNKADLTILHVVKDAEEDVPWHDYPSVRSTLERWGYLEPGAARHHVADKIGIKVRKMVGVAKDVPTSIVGMAEKYDFDLIVMATNENRENPFFKQDQIAVSVSQKTQLPTLFVPQDVGGCVSAEDGTVQLNQVLLPVAEKPDSQSIVNRMSHAADNFGVTESHVTVLHVGSEDKFPKLVMPETENINWTMVNRNGTVAGCIVEAANKLDADVIAMVTEGKKGFWDAVRGSTVEQVLRRTPCPVFTIPAEEWD